MSVTAEMAGLRTVAPTGASGWGRTRTERNWLTSMAILAGSVALAGAVYALEWNAGRWNGNLRFVYSPSETVMRLFGISHVLIATLYLLTSRGMRSARSVALFTGMLALGIGLCFGFARVNALSPAIASAFFILYFAAHDFRDQVFFYFEHGEAPADADRRRMGRVLYWVPMWLLLAIPSALAALTVAQAPGTARLREKALVLPVGWLWGLGLLLAAVFLWASVRLGQVWRAAGLGPFRSHVLANRPIYTVFAGTILIVLLGVFPAWNVKALVILHVTGWYVFTLRVLRQRPAKAAAPLGTWQWLRATPAGFNVLHLGTLAIVAAALAVWVYGFAGDPGITPLWAALDVDHFPIWTLLHVTVSFRPR